MVQTQLLALLALGVGKDDEVITVSNTAVPTVSAILETGAKPVFCDVNLDDYNIDTDLVENLISKRLRLLYVFIFMVMQLMSKSSKRFAKKIIYF